MNVAENIKLMESAAAAADARAMSMLAIAADVDGTRKRLAELKDATAAHDAARDAAEAARAAAETWEQKGNAALEAMASKIQEFEAWKSGTEKSLKAREAAVGSAEAALATRELNLKNREADHAQHVAEHTAMMKRLALHVAGYIK